MERRLKERLTGAAILVALIVLVVPELFRGPPRASKEPGAAGAARAPPSYTIDLSGNPPAAAASASAGAGPAAAASASPVPARSTPEVAASPAAGATSAVSAAPAALAVAASGAAGAPDSGSATGTASASGATSVSGVAHAARMPAKRPASAGAPVSGTVARESPTSSHGSRGHLHVQLGLFADHSYALRLARRARAAGFHALVTGPDAHRHYRVLLAGTHSRAQARALERALRARGMAAIAVSAP